MVTISVPFRWVCASVFFDLGEGTLLGRQRMHGLAVVTGDAAVTGYDENPYLPVVHQLLRGRRQTFLRGKMQFHALPQTATGHQILFRQILHFVSMCYRESRSFPKAGVRSLPFPNPPETACATIHLPHPPDAPPATLKPSAAIQASRFFSIIPTYYEISSPTNARHDEYRSSKQRNSRRAASPPVESFRREEVGVWGGREPFFKRVPFPPISKIKFFPMDRRQRRARLR